MTVTTTAPAFTAIDLLSALATAHGGHSQYSEAAVGAAVYGHFANGGRLVGTYADADAAITAAAAERAEMWADCGAEEADTRDAIVAGYRAAHAARCAYIDEKALRVLTGGLPVHFIPALWGGNGAPEGAVGTHLKGRVDGRYVYGVCSGQQTEDGADEVSCYELWPAVLEPRQMLR